MLASSTFGSVDSDDDDDISSSGRASSLSSHAGQDDSEKEVAVQSKTARSPPCSFFVSFPFLFLFVSYPCRDEFILDFCWCGLHPDVSLISRSLLKKKDG